MYLHGYFRAISQILRGIEANPESIAVIVLNIDQYERYIARYIILKGLLLRHESSILANILDILSNIPLFDIKIAHPIRI